MVLNTTVVTHRVVVTSFVHLQLPVAGVAADTVGLSASLENCGEFDRISILPSVTSVCAVDAASTVDYLTKRPNAVSSVQFSWTAGPAGDRAAAVSPKTAL